jgi:hypothetical protein
MGRIVAVVIAGGLFLFASAHSTFAQECNPYGHGDTNPACHVIQPEPSPAQCIDPYGTGVMCSVAGVNTTATVFKFGEGVVHAPGSELAWIILTNFDTVGQTTFVELLLGSGQRVKRSVTLQPKERKDLSLHEFPELAGLVTFSTGVYFPLSTGHASLVMRPQSDVWAKVVLPPPTVSGPGEK